MRAKNPTVAELQSRLDLASVELKMLRDENRIAPSNATLRQFCEAVEGCALPPDTVLAAAVVRGSQSTVSVFPIAQLREVATIIRRRIPL